MHATPELFQPVTFQLHNLNVQMLYQMLKIYGSLLPYLNKSKTININFYQFMIMDNVDNIASYI